MKKVMERTFTLIERLAACTAIAAGGRLVILTAYRLTYGPVAPQIFGFLVWGTAFWLAGWACIDFTGSMGFRSTSATVLGAVFSIVLMVAATYVVEAAMVAARDSVALKSCVQHYAHPQHRRK
jgi:hypothetical protein